MYPSPVPFPAFNRKGRGGLPRRTLKILCDLSVILCYLCGYYAANRNKTRILLLCKGAAFAAPIGPPFGNIL